MDFVGTTIINHQLSIIILIKIPHDWLILYGTPIIVHSYVNQLSIMIGY